MCKQIAVGLYKNKHKLGDAELIFLSPYWKLQNTDERY